MTNTRRPTLFDASCTALALLLRAADRQADSPPGPAQEESR